MTPMPTSGIRAKIADLKRRKLLRLAKKAEEATGAEGMAESIEDQLTDDTRPLDFLRPSVAAKPMLFVFRKTRIGLVWWKLKGLVNRLFGRGKK